MLKAGLIGGLIRASNEDGGRQFWIIDMHPDRDPFERLQNGVERLYWCSKGQRRESLHIQAGGAARGALHRLPSLLSCRRRRPARPYRGEAALGR